MAERQRRRAAAKRQRREQRQEQWEKRHPGRVKTSSSHPTDNTAFHRMSTRRGLHNGRAIVAEFHRAWVSIQVQATLEEGQRIVDEARRRAE